MGGVRDVAATQAALAFSYDRIPYDSQPFADARPAYLAALGVLHGLRPAMPSSCRVLELGCASGGHIIPLAWHHPRSHFVGIDLSDGQIQVGRELVRSAGLDNCSLHVGDLGGFQPGEDGFDYVIAHGLYSWVPEHTRTAILALCRRVLRPGGIAYVSYNTLPGWRMRGLTRDLLEWPLQGDDSPEQRLERSRALIDHLAGAADLDSPSSYLEMEVARIRSRPPSYLAHEYLEPDNRAFLFGEFVEQAAGAGLRYLCNADLGTGFPELYGDMGEAMADLSDDPVRVEQYLDFVAGRAFRQSLLCRDDEPPTFLDHRRIDQLWLVADLRPPPKLDLRRTKVQRFVSTDGTEVEVSHPVCKAIMGQLSRCYPQAMRYPDLVEAAVRQVRDNGDARHADDVDVALGELFGLIVMQHIEPVAEALEMASARSNPPRASRLAAAQAGLGWSHVATVMHRSLDLDPFARTLLSLLDGARERKVIDELMLDWLATHSPTGRDGTGNARHRVQTNVSRLLNLFSRHGILDEIR
jgi:SAM-dependent methyltransferase